MSTATNKNDMYSKILDLRQINTAGAAIFEVRLLLRRKGVFLQSNMVDAFIRAMEIIGRAQIERLVQFQHPKGGVGFEASSYFLKEGEGIVDKLGSSVRARLQSE